MILLYLASTAFFIYQHTTGLSWDFAVHVLNAKYIFDSGYYFEWNRPPLTTFAIGILSVFGWKAAEYLFIIAVSTLFLFSSIFFADVFKIDRRLFYVLSLNPFVLINGLKTASELLSYSLLQLFAASIFYKHKKSTLLASVFASLAAMTRYTNINYLALILFKNTKKFKKYFLNLLIFAILVLIFFLPWFLYNYAATSDPLTSIMDSYAINVRFRADYMAGSFNFAHLAMVLNYLIPITILALFLKIKKSDFNRKDAALILFLLLALFSYYKVPLKRPRYLFNILLPCIYFSSAYIDRIKPRIKKGLVYLFLSLNVMIMAFSFSEVKLEKYYVGPESTELIRNCASSSNLWVPLNYNGIATGQPPYKELVGQEIEEGRRLLFYTHTADPPYIQNEPFMSQFPVIKRTENYILLGNRTKCLPIEKIDDSYLNALNRLFLAKYGEPLVLDRCSFFINKKFCSIFPSNTKTI